MKKLTLIAFSIVAFTACDNAQKKTNEPSEEKHSVVGAQEDDHGCLVAAGETWSELNQKCIKVFEIGFRLNPIEVEKGQAIVSAFVLLNDDQSKTELFLPNKSNSIILFRAGEGTYQDDVYRYNSETAILYVNGKQEYKGNVE